MTYRPTPLATRLPAAVLALLMGFLPLSLMLLRPDDGHPPRPATISLRLLPLPMPVQDRLEARARPSVPRAKALPITTPSAVALMVPASAPLDLRITKAMLAGTRSEVGRMADASGAFVGDAPKGLDHKLAQGVAGSAKMDCLGPNGGGSLLSILVIAVQAARSKCAGQ